MPFAIAALLLGFVAAAAAQESVYNEVHEAGPQGGAVVTVAPTSEFSAHYANGYNYVTYYSHHKEYVYTYQTCSSPPSSVEVCLTSIFASVEHYLSLIDISLKSYEVSIQSQMHSEHSLLYDEVSWVAKVNYIAVQVKEAVSIDYEAEYKQVKELVLEKEQINEAYEIMLKELGYLEVEIQDIQEYEREIYKKYASIRYAKWSVYYYISEIKYEKEIIVREVDEIQQVVEVLYEQIVKINVKVDELYKREEWLVSWESKLSMDMSSFQKDIARFKDVEIDLKKQEVLLYSEQKRLMVEVEYVEKAMEKLELEYVHIVSYLKQLEIYEKEIYSLDEYISHDASVFISAYSDFTCEDSLLYYEACASSKAPVVYAAPTAVAAPAKKTAAGPV